MKANSCCAKGLEGAAEFALIKPDKRFSVPLERTKRPRRTALLFVAMTVRSEVERTAQLHQIAFQILAVDTIDVVEICARVFGAQ